MPSRMLRPLPGQQHRDPRNTQSLWHAAAQHAHAPQGESAKALARALRAAGVRRPYILAGGFRGWSAAGLAVRKGAAEYDASPLDALSDTAETGGCRGWLGQRLPLCAIHSGALAREAHR